MTVRELIQQLLEAVENNPDDIALDSRVQISMGIINDLLKAPQQEPEISPLEYPDIMGEPTKLGVIWEDLNDEPGPGILVIYS